MAIKDILVHVADGEAGAQCIDAAVKMAERQDAHVTGVYVLQIPAIPGYVEAQIGRDILAIQRAHYEESASVAQSAFEQTLSQAGLMHEWRCVEGTAAEVLALHARYSDLVVIARDTPVSAEGMGNLAQTVMLESGRPVLIVPPAGVGQSIGKHVMVAWNGGREAVRAVQDALPVLQRADRVDVIAVDPLEISAAHGDVPAADICVHLARHDVRAQAQSVASGGHEVGATVLERALVDGADLVVMGGYGHSRWREMVLGGATKHVLDHCKLPVLMSH